MKLLYVTDLHGSQWKYDQILLTAKRLQVDGVVNGGDMLPKSSNLFAQGQFITDYLDRYFAQFDELGIYYLCILGNDDLRIFDQLFEDTCAKYPFIFSLAEKRVVIHDLEFIGFSWVVDYPFRLKDRCRMDTRDYRFQVQMGTGLLSTEAGWQEIPDWFSYANTLPTIADELTKLVNPQDASRSIYVIHMPPSRMGLDECGNGLNVGSQAVYDFVLAQQSMYAFHGHIHESPRVSGTWQAPLGSTICIQPGQLDPLTYVTINTESALVERHEDSYQPSI